MNASQIWTGLSRLLPAGGERDSGGVRRREEGWNMMRGRLEKEENDGRRKEWKDRNEKEGCRKERKGWRVVVTTGRAVMYTHSFHLR